MKSYLQYNDPIRIQFRSGSASDPYVSLTESQKIISNVIILHEIPDEFTHVTIPGYTESYSDVPATATGFVVNYTNGMIKFDSSQEGKDVTVSYKGRGFILYPAERIYAHGTNPDVTVSLQDMIDGGNQALTGLEKLTGALTDVSTATTNANTQATYAKNQGDYGKAQGDYAKTQGDYGKAQGDAAKAAADALVYKGVYASGTAYIARNIIYYNGSTYMCVLASTGNLPTNTTYWKRISGMYWRAVYSASNTYNYGDFVSDATGNTLYMSIVDANLNKALTDTASWSKIISVQTAIDNAVTAVASANAATTAANTAKTNADTATSSANAAAAAANTAKANADTATSNANTATTNANTAASNADAKALYANQQGDYAKSVGDSLVHKGNYVASTAYAPRNIVYYNGSTYMNIAASTGVLPTDSSKWQKITNMVWKGTYSASTTYNFGDVVSDNVNQNVYICIADGTLNKALTLTANWTVLMSVTAAINSANTATTAANNATTAANTAKTNADTAASNANTAASYATDQGDYAKTQGDYAKAQGAAATTAKTNADTATTNANAARDAANTAASAANTAKTNADTATTNANTAASNADAKAALAVTATTNANNATTAANTAKTNADTATAAANKAKTDADTATAAANKAKSDADTATAAANKAKTDADTATANAVSATTAANTATTNANTAKDAANAAANAANTAKTDAVAATTAATNATTAANTAKTNADTATTNANTATTAANTATTAANAARDAANTAKTNADTATTSANTARDAANAAAANANAVASATVHKGTYNATTAYVPNNIVDYNGSSYMNIVAATGVLPTDSTKWKLVSLKGDQGIQGIQGFKGDGIAWKGVYSATTAYVLRDVVHYNGTAYINKLTSTGNLPTNTGYWDIFASKGVDGEGSVIGIVSSNDDLVVAGTIQTPDISVSTTLKNLWNDKYTKAEVDSKISQATANIQWKASVSTYEDIATTYSSPQDGWTVNVNDTDYTYRYTGTQWIAISANSIPNASATADGKMSTADFTKLQGVTAQATKVVGSATNGNIIINGIEDNVYTHPTGAGNNHVPTGGAAGNYLKYSASGVAAWSTPELAGLADATITTPASGHYLTHNGTKWVNATLPVVTTSVNGLMIALDKTKLDSIASGANNYSHPAGDGNLHVPANSTTSNGKFLEATATAGVYQWANITASDITLDASNRFVTDTEKTTWNAKATTAVVTTSVNGLMIAADKTKLDGVAAGATIVTNPATNGVITINGVNQTVYAHPTGDGNLHVPANSTTNNGKFLEATATAGVYQWANITASDITLDASNRFVTDTEKTTWNAKASTAVATSSVNGLMSAADKAKLDTASTASVANSIVMQDAERVINVHRVATRLGSSVGGQLHHALYTGDAASGLRWGTGMFGAESSGNAGSDWALWAYTDTGAAFGKALSVTRASLDATFAGTITTPALYVNRAANSPAIRLTSSSAGWGSGMYFENTAATGKTYGIYSGSDGYLHMGLNTADILTMYPDLSASFVGGLDVKGQVSVRGDIIAGTANSTLGFIVDVPYASGTMWGRGMAVRGSVVANQAMFGAVGNGSTINYAFVGFGTDPSANQAMAFYPNKTTTAYGTMTINGNLNLSATAPIIDLTETDQATNEKKWWIVPDSKMLQIRTLTDAGGTGATALSIQRGTGTAVQGIAMTATNITLAGSTVTVQNTNDAIMYLYSTGSAANAKQGYISYQNGLLKLGTVTDAGAGTNHLTITNAGVISVGNSTMVSNLNAQYVGGATVEAIRAGRENNKIRFTVAGDKDTFYPILLSSGAKWGFNTYSLTRGYNWEAPATWGQGNGTHKAGLTFTWMWTGDGAWGGNDKALRVVEFNETYDNVVGGMVLTTSGLLVWLRGGGALYEYQSEMGVYATASIYLDGITASDGAVFPARTKATALASIASEINAKYPVRNNGFLYVSDNEVWHKGNMQAPSANADAWTVAVRGTNGVLGATQFVATAAQGMAPITTSSNTLVANLNADYVDGYQATTTNTASAIVVRDSNGIIQANRGYFLVAQGNAPLQITSTTLVSNLNVQYLNGIQSSGFMQTSHAANSVTTALINTWNGKASVYAGSTAPSSPATNMIWLVTG